MSEIRKALELGFAGAWLSLSFFTLGCGASWNGDHILELRPAVKVGATDARCTLEPPIVDKTVTQLSGRSIDAHVAWNDGTVFRVTRETKLRVRDFAAESRERRPGFEVVVVPEAVEARGIVRAIREHTGCYWLVTLDEQIVQLEVPGERADGGIAGGIFPSLDSALAAYGRAREEVVLEVVSDAEGARKQQFWDWRRRMDLWQIACEAELRQNFQQEHSKEYESLAATLAAIDCSDKPKPPEEIESTRRD